MLAHSLKAVLTLVPEALPMVKSASIDVDYPTNSAASALASRLAIHYHANYDYSPVSKDQLDKVASAVKLFQVEDDFVKLAKKMDEAALAKKASAAFTAEDKYLQKQAEFENSLVGFYDLSEVSNRAHDLYKEACACGVDPSLRVKRYSGNYALLKSAALNAIEARKAAAGKEWHPHFEKVAQAFERMDSYISNPSSVRSLCSTVAELDKLAGVSRLGFDFFKETLVEKSAAVSQLTITVAGKQVPYESFVNAGKERLTQYLSAEVAKELDSPESFKAVIETLPLDMQRLALTVVGS